MSKTSLFPIKDNKSNTYFYFFHKKLKLQVFVEMQTPIKDY